MKKTFIFLCITLSLLFVTGCEHDKTPEPPALKAITLDKIEITLMAGETTEIKVMPDPIDFKNLKITWTTSDDKVATIDNGKINAVAKGKAIITAEASGKKAICTVTVKQDIDKALRSLLITNQDKTNEIYLVKNSENETAYWIKGEIVSKDSNTIPFWFIYRTEETYEIIEGVKNINDHSFVFENPRITATEDESNENESIFNVTFTVGTEEKKFKFTSTGSYFTVAKADPPSNLATGILLQLQGEGSAEGIRQPIQVITVDTVYDIVLTMGTGAPTITYNGNKVGEFTPDPSGIMIFTLKNEETNKTLTLKRIMH